MPLNEHHKRHLLSSFRYVDGLLANMEALLSPGGENSPFSQYVRDLSPVQKKVTADVIAQLREQMTEALTGLDIALPRPEVSSQWAIRSALMNVQTALVELEPGYMRGYGAVDESAGKVLTGFVATLQKTVRRLGDFLSEGPGQGFQERLARLERAGRDLGLLQKIEAVITRHGLVEFRPPLGLILERLESDQFEIALFGQVSSGKSSLLNQVLGTAVLPVGVTPVTALPTRLLYDEAPGVSIVYADRPQEEAPLERLVDFVAEQGNPGNGRHVSRISVRLPSPRLKEGIVFVDTPGIGSLAASGSAEALAYLPRCDLGVVLLEAGSAVGPEDIRLLQLLYESGTPVMILVSKSDLLSEADLERVIGYIRECLAENLGESLPIHAVSAVEPHTWRIDQWFAQEILPLYARHRDLAQASISRKIGHLRHSIVQVLRGLAAKPQAANESVSKEESVRIRALLREGTERLAATRRDCGQRIEAVPGTGEALIAQTVEALVTQWRQDRRADLGAALRQAVAAELEPHGLALSRTIQALGDFLEQTLSAANERVPLPASLDDFAAKALVTGLPAAEAVLSPRFSVEFRRPWWLWGLRPFWRSCATRRVRRFLAADLSIALEAYARQLDAWTKARLDRLENLYDSLAGSYRLLLREPAAADPADELLADLDELEEKVGGYPLGMREVVTRAMAGGRKNG